MDINTVVGAASFVLMLFESTKEINPLYQKYKSTVTVYNEVYENKLRECVNEIPEEFITQPRQSIILPAMERSLYYISENEVREMFAKLIASSFDSRKNEFLHPGFVDLISQLSPNDARILSYINSHKEFIGIMCVKNKEEYPIINSKIVIDIGVEQTAISIINLTRLGLLNFNYYFVQTGIIEEIEGVDKIIDPLDYVSPEIKGYLSSFNYKLQVNDGFLTQLGKAFLKVCID